MDVLNGHAHYSEDELRSMIAKKNLFTFSVKTRQDVVRFNKLSSFQFAQKIYMFLYSIRNPN